MVNYRRVGPLAVVAATLIVSGCVGGVTPREIASRPTGVEGQWMDTQGVAISTFSGGRFDSVATDTGSKLSEGTYRMRDRNNVEITMTSLIRQTRTNVNCALVSPNQLNCTNASGQNFVLTRRGGVS
ncbi:hypothetical protein [Nitratireductor thuwali]|uniref:Outer membrane lipoprotein omp10 n=1 Tax=Nitratireductor thuwali TaxID=2267699 RepID=A0ABY5MGF0_9HYPH|nr:Outer membrane lipoprotein omp10 [Nitratireductor thuwali]